MKHFGEGNLKLMYSAIRQCSLTPPLNASGSSCSPPTRQADREREGEINLRETLLWRCVHAGWCAHLMEAVGANFHRGAVSKAGRVARVAEHGGHTTLPMRASSHRSVKSPSVETKRRITARHQFTARQHNVPSRRPTTEPLETQVSQGSEAGRHVFRQLDVTGDSQIVLGSR
jgi:hypothetical protein